MLSFFAKEFQRFNEFQAGTPGQSGSTPSSKEGAPPTKRRRLDEHFTFQHHTAEEASQIPTKDELDLLLRAYYAHVHPWIPMLHEARLRRRLNNDTERRNLGVVIRAMLLVAAKYIHDDDTAKTMSIPEQDEQRARDEIVATAMRKLSVENLQALIMVAFNDVSASLISFLNPNRSRLEAVKLRKPGLSSVHSAATSNTSSWPWRMMRPSVLYYRNLLSP